MAKHKETLLDKFVKRDYNNDLEEILSEKAYQEEAKNLLLDILYKIDISYKDYETVKKNVVPKEEYIENIIEVVKNNCDLITFMEFDGVKKKKPTVNRKKKQIVCYHISQKLLYCLADIQKRDDIIKQESEMVNKALTNAINIGNNINMVEPLRDFNGYCWNISVLDFENFYYNLIYQDLIILVGNKILEEWVNKNDETIDYIELFKTKLEKEYGRKMAEDIIEILKTLSVLIYFKANAKFKKEVSQNREKLEEELRCMKNKGKYLNDLSKEKKEIEKEIKKIDIILNDKNKLKKRYIKRSKELEEIGKKFDEKMLIKELKSIRKEKVAELKKCNEKMHAKNFIKRQQELEYEIKYLKLLESENIKKDIAEQIIYLQKAVLQVFKLKIKDTNTREDLMRILYEIRYFNLIPVDVEKNVGQISRLKRTFTNVKDEAIIRAYDLRIIAEISKDSRINEKILEHIFSLNIIRLEDLYIKIVKDKEEKYFIQFFDEDAEDERFLIDFELKEEELKIKTNKKVKLFI